MNYTTQTPDAAAGTDLPRQAALTGRGSLWVRSATGRDALPVTGVSLRLTLEDGTTRATQTDDTGLATFEDIPCPPAALSLDEANTQRPYSTVDLSVSREGYDPQDYEGIQIFDTQQSMLDLALIPSEDPDGDQQVRTPAYDPEQFDIPPHKLYTGGDSSGPEPEQTCPAPRVLPQPIIPNRITVHLGKPAASARNVTVSFRDYIKNVASSEVYPTWPEEALRANIHAQISLALNRIFTEWYKSKGYNFDITNSTSYDQYYVHGRSIFEPMDRITEEIFNTYARKQGTIDPYYTEYCDGKTVSCKGMKQWGTVTLAQQGRNALQILQYYYGNDLELVRTNNIADIPESYPGTPLRIGSTGDAVRVIQRQLNRIAQDYPFFGRTSVDGVFGQTTADVVKKFQKQFNLTQDGVVGRATWYKISYIYVSVKKLAQLTSEGERPSGDLVAGTYPGTALRQGSRGDSVEQVQFWLSELADYIPGMTAPAVDGVFGAGTESAVRTFQRHYGLTVDGVVGKATWDKLYAEYTSLEADITPPEADGNRPGTYPGTALRQGSRGDSVRRLQFWLRIISHSNSAIPTIIPDGIFGAATLRAVQAFQTFYGLAADGVVGRVTWDKVYEVYTGLLNGLLAPSERPGTYPGSPLRVGSRGRAVKEVQYYLYLLSAYYTEIPQIAYDGIYGQATANAVRAFQRLFKLTEDGVVGPATWNAIYSRFSTLRSSSGPVLSYRVFAYPGYDLKEGISGDMVRFAQFMLAYVAWFYDAVTPISELDGVFGAETVDAVKAFQREFALPITGVVDEATWNALALTYLSLASDTTENGRAPGQYPGYALVFGSAGGAVLELQRLMNSIAARFCSAWFVPESGIFDQQTLDAVKEFQQGFGLPVTGLVDRETWDTIYDYSIL
jgi:peptidoglycan hydrolase-like protein with peptidoglycan-binding domain